MKSFSIKFIFLFIILMLTHELSSSAQDYVITTKGDSLVGKIKLFTYGSDKKVQVTDSLKKKTLVPIFHVVYFVYKGEKYHPLKSERGYSFMKILKDGYLSLNAFQLDNQTAYDGLYLYMKDGKGLEVPNLSFKKLMTKYLADCPSVVAKIEDGTWGKKELNQIVDDYNQCIVMKSNLVHQNPVVVEQAPVKEVSSWNTLEDKVKSHPDFTDKSNALEMINEIKNKIQHNESIPNFLIQGLKSTLSQTSLNEDLENAIKALN